MKFRSLRIVWSVTWGVVTVLLVVLWVRSYSGIDCSDSMRIASSQGNLYVNQSMTLTTPENYRGPILAKPLFGSFYRLSPAGNRVKLLRPGFGIPYWSMTLTALALAVAPWTIRKWRFSLRTLLMTTTLIAIALGIIVWMSRPG